ncbi:MAG: nucleotidyltransferase domain-containing protein [Saprospiraceae bacterium]|nr:nucleotidyltransferase domain-containing protein [Saprospiraceae bacterium]
MILKDLDKKGLINPPQWLINNTQYLCITGSKSYGTNIDDSDMDLAGWVIPPKRLVFFHLDGEIEGFGTPKKRFTQFQHHHVMDESANGGKGREYDITVHHITKYFNLCMTANPNYIDLLYIPFNCILHSSPINEMVRENRELFLSKLAFKTFKSYAYSRLHAMHSKKAEGKRKKLIEQFGFDVKCAANLVRLLSEVEQILMEHDLDLQEEGRREHMKAIRRGEVSEQDIRDWFASKEKELEKLYINSTLRAKPDEGKIKQLLINCLETHYGNLEECVVNPDATIQALRDIQTILNRHQEIIRN